MFNNLKAKWLSQRENKLEAEYQSVITALMDAFVAKKDKFMREIETRESELSHIQRDVDDLTKRVNDKKLDLEKKNQELADQIRLIEAKASPDAVWTSAFQAGFSKCWDTMWNYQADQIMGLKDKIRSQAINETLGRLNGNILPKT